MDCGILCHSLDGSRIVRINGAALRILGYKSLSELMAAGFDMISTSVLEKDRPKLRNPKRIALSGIQIKIAH